MAPLVALIVKTLVTVGAQKAAEKAAEHFTQPKGQTQMEVMLGLIRHLLTAGGGALAAKGYIDAGTVETIVGSIITLLGAAWSIYDKKKAEPAE